MGQDPGDSDPQARASYTSSHWRSCPGLKQIRGGAGDQSSGVPFLSVRDAKTGGTRGDSPVADLNITIITVVCVTWGREELGAGQGDGRRGNKGRERARQYLTTILPPYQPSKPGLAGSWSHFHGCPRRPRRGKLRQGREPPVHPTPQS